MYEELVWRFVVVKIKTIRNTDRLLVGQVTVTDQDNIKVMCIKKSNDLGTLFAFPEKEDRCWICRSQIVKILPEPMFDDTRFNYKFLETIENIYS